MSVSGSIFLKVLFPVFIPFFVLLLSVVSAQSLLQAERTEVKTRIADKALMTQTNLLSKRFNHCSVSLSVHSITKSQMFAMQFKKIAKEIPEGLEAFKQLPVITEHQRNLKAKVESSTAEGMKTIDGALSAINDKTLTDDVKQQRVRELYTSLTTHAQQLHETAQEIGKGVISEDREKGHSHRRIKYVGSILIAYISALIILFAFAKFTAKEILMKKGVSVTRKIFFQGVIPVFLPILVLSSLVVFLTDQVHRAENEVRKLVSDISIIEHATAVSDLVSEVSVCSSGYSHTKHTLLSDRVDAALARIPEELSELRKLFKYQTDQEKQIDKIEEIVGKQSKLLVEKRDLLRDDKAQVEPVLQTPNFNASHYLADQAHDSLAELSEPARKIADEDATDKASNPALVVVGVVLLSALAALFLCFLYAKNLAKYFSSNF